MGVVARDRAMRGGPSTMKAFFLAFETLSQ
jgi:hypothetical protein